MCTSWPSASQNSSSHDMSKAKDTAWATRSTGVSRGSPVVVPVPVMSRVASPVASPVASRSAVAVPEGDDAAPRVRSRTASTAGAKIRLRWLPSMAARPSCWTTTPFGVPVEPEV